METMRASLASKYSSSSSNNNNEVFKVYFKGLVSHETVLNVKMVFAGIGVAICDTSDRCVFESRKSFLLEAGARGTEDDIVELEALIEALNVALKLELRRVQILCDSNSVYQYFIGQRRPTNNKIATLVDQADLIHNKFIYHAKDLVQKKDIKFVYTLARRAIVSEATKWDVSDSGVTVTEPCTICCEYFDLDQIYSVNNCLHRYCFSCMRKHVEAKLLQGQLPECPHENCVSIIGLESCKKFLKPELYKIMWSRVKEACIPLKEKVYCPFTNCSALMSKTEVDQHTRGSSSSYVLAGDIGMSKCVECDRFFCINCKVPWHDYDTCSDYKKSYAFQLSDEAKLQSLVTNNRWRQCNMCKNMIERTEGCPHMKCRCGHQFCYVCGARWPCYGPYCRLNFHR